MAIQKRLGSSGPAGTWTAGATMAGHPATPGTAFGSGPRTPAHLLALQRSVGNRATSAVLAAKPANPVVPTTAARSVAADVTVQRTVTDADRAWAQTTNDSVEQIQDAVTKAQREVNADATVASAALKVVQTEYATFERRYWAAVSRFTRGVEAAQAHEQQLRDSIQTTVELALFGVTGPWTTASSAASKAVKTIDAIYKYFEAAQNVAQVTTDLGTLGGGSISEPAVTFKDAAVPLLQAKSDRDIEQELAIRWIGGLSWDQLDEIDTADDYFISIGLIDGRGNRLALDTG